MKVIKSLAFTLLSILSQYSHANSVCDKNIIVQVEGYLDSHQKVAIPFDQSHNDDPKISGLLLISKPLKFRVNYDSPHPFVIAGGKNFVSLYDYDLDELSRIDAKDNMFRFLLELNTKIESDLKIISCSNTNKNIEIELLHHETQQKAKIIFREDHSIALSSLIVPDDGSNYEKGYVRMDFKTPIYLNAISEEFFILKEPKIYGPPKRYKASDLIQTISKK